MTEKESTSTSYVPSELRLTQKWDYAAETFITKIALGAAVTGFASIVLFRGRHSRAAFTCFGAGVGAGDAFRLSSIAFEKEKNEK